MVSASIRPDGAAWSIAVDGRAPVVAPDLIAAVRALNHELMHALMRRHQQLFFVHAGVVARGGRAIVLPGLSRAGKSTLVLALLHRGAQLLSDELLVYDPSARALLPFPRAVKVRDECVGYFAAYAPHFVGDGEGRFLPFTALDAAVIAPHATAGIIVAPRWQPDGDNQPRAITSGQGLLHLAQSALNFGSQRERSVDHLAALAGDSACFEMAWREPHAAASALLEGLEASLR